ncbi:MAG TPA: DUF1385 domain-containing protein [Actinomycetota bacterium]|jgi:uncharacterized protein YqhQ
MSEGRPAPRPSIGGQAVLEGVMMRGPESWSVACRRPDETIAVERHPLPNYAERHPWLKWPLARGCLVLGESMSIGIKALMISANHAMEEDEQLSEKQLGWTLATAMILFSAIFIVLPVLGTRLIHNLVGEGGDSKLVSNLIEGAIRLGMFVGYLLLIGTFKDVRRVFQYHGAEHKTIYAYENGDPLEPAEIDRKYSTLHVRCGTNFLFIVLFLTIIAHFLLDILVSASLLPRIGIRLAAIPVLAGISYEAIKLASKNEDSIFFKVAMLPGLALQKITTKPPTLDQIEVAIAAMQAVAPEEHGGTGDAIATTSDVATAAAEPDAGEAPESPVA